MEGGREEERESVEDSRASSPHDRPPDAAAPPLSPMRSSSASPPRQPLGCPICGCSCRPLVPAKRRASGGPFGPSGARVAASDERHALREAFTRQSADLEDLRRDLEEERSASSTAASEAMSMILRLQREKAEVQMESRQFRQFAEEKIAHDQNQIANLEDECYRREQAIEALLLELSAYRRRLLAHGLDPEADPASPEYPQVRCIMPDDGHPAADSPREGRLVEIEERIAELEKTGGGSGWAIEETEKAVVDVPEAVDHGGDRVYTVDAIHRAGTPRSGVGSEEADIRRLYTRIQALEADRESLKQEIVSMRTQKAQVVLLKEIAENLSKGMAVSQPPPRVIPTKKPSVFAVFSFFNAIKFFFSSGFWTQNRKRCRYMLQYVNGRVGLLIILDKTQHVRQLRCVTRPIGCGESYKMP